MSKTLIVTTDEQDCSSVYNMSQIKYIEIRTNSDDPDFKNVETEFQKQFFKEFFQLFVEKALLNIMWDLINPVSCWQSLMSNTIDNFSAPIGMDKIPQKVIEIDREYRHFLSVINGRVFMGYIPHISHRNEHTHTHIGTSLISIIHTKPIIYESSYWALYGDDLVHYGPQGWYAEFFRSYYMD